MKNKEKDAFIKALFYKTHTPLVIMDAVSHNFIDCNNAAIKIYGGNTKEDLLGKQPVDFSPNKQYKGEDSFLLQKERIGEVLEKESICFEWNHLNSNGKNWDAEVHLMSFEYGNKKIIKFSLSNITERKKKNQRLIDSEHSLKSIFDNVTDAIYILDKNGVFIDINKGAIEMYGYSREELLGKSPVMVSAPGRNDFEMVDESIAKAYRGEPQQFEFWAKRKNGEEFPKIVRVSSGYRFGEKVIFAFATDITERKKMEDALRLSEEKTKAQYKGIPVPTYTLRYRNNDFVLEDFNDAAVVITDGVIEKYLGKTVNKVFSKRLEIEENISRCFYNEVSIREELSYKMRLTGLEKDFVVKYAFIPPDMVVVHTDDITERKNAERKNAERKKQLEKLNITKDKFFSIIAHDLKNPMANLVSFVDLLLEDYDCFDDVERKNIIEVLYTDASRTLSLLENLLGWSLAQSGGLQADPEKLDISEIVTENIKLFFVSAGKKNIKVVNNIPNLQEVFADRKMVDAVIRNLLSNAIKFTENGTISFSSVVKGEKLQISVVDTGRGMKKKVVDNLFKIEESNSQDGTYGEKGTGIGLHLVKEFLKLNSGEISVESTPEKGSTFTVSLPL